MRCETCGGKHMVMTLSHGSTAGDFRVAAQRLSEANIPLIDLEENVRKLRRKLSLLPTEFSLEGPVFFHNLRYVEGPHQGKPKKFYHHLNDKYNRHKGGVR